MPCPYAEVTPPFQHEDPEDLTLPSGLPAVAFIHIAALLPHQKKFFFPF